MTTGPPAPEGLVAESLLPTRVAVSWTDRSAMELGYEVLRSEDEILVPAADLPADATGLTEGSLSQETGYYDASAGPQVPGPDVVVRLEGFEFVSRGTEFRTVTVRLTGADLGEFESGAIPVSFSLEVGDAKCGDTYVASSTGRSIRY